MTIDLHSLLILLKLIQDAADWDGPLPDEWKEDARHYLDYHHRENPPDTHPKGYERAFLYQLAPDHTHYQYHNELVIWPHLELWLAKIRKRTAPTTKPIAILLTYKPSDTINERGQPYPTHDASYDDVTVSEVFTYYHEGCRPK